MSYCTVVGSTVRCTSVSLSLLFLVTLMWYMIFYPTVKYSTADHVVQSDVISVLAMSQLKDYLCSMKTELSGNATLEIQCYCTAYSISHSHLITEYYVTELLNTMSTYTILNRNLVVLWISTPKIADSTALKFFPFLLDKKTASFEGYQRS